MRRPGGTTKTVVLCLVLVVGAWIRVAHAQSRVSPYAAAALGVSDVRTQFPWGGPGMGEHRAQHGVNVLAAANVGIELGGHLGADASVRSSVGIGKPLRAVTLGPAVRWGRRVQAHVRGGLGRVERFEGVLCVDFGSSCPDYTSEWTTGFDLSAGVDFLAGGRWIVGPEVWWVQSTGGTVQHRSMGIGARVRYR